MPKKVNSINFLKKNASKLIAAALAFSSLLPLSVNAQNPAKFFDKKDVMQVGSYYYPEQWPESNWERDIKKMSELGFEFTHFGEFAWSTLEPEEGKYNFEWLDN